MLPLAIACFLLAAVETAAIGRTFAAKHGGRLDANQEFLALAASNLASGLGRGFPVSGGMSQSLVNEGGGARTPLSGGIAAGIMLVVVLFFSHLLRALPQPVLAAVVLVAVAGLFKVSALQHLWRGDRPEFVVAMEDAAGTHFIDATQSVPMVADAANAPVFVVDDVDVGRGTVGGNVFSFALAGQVAARMAVRVLNGEKPRDIPIVKGANTYMERFFLCVSFGHGLRNRFTDWAFPISVRILPRKPVLFSGGADDSLCVLEHYGVVVDLGGVFELRFRVTAADGDCI